MKFIHLAVLIPAMIQFLISFHCMLIDMTTKPSTYLIVMVSYLVSVIILILDGWDR